MTAPDSLCFHAGKSRARDSELLRIRIDEALDPAYLALFAVRDWEIAAHRGFSLQLDARAEHGGGVAALQQDACDLLAVRSLSALEHSLRGYPVVGCLFDAPGGVLVREDRLAKLRMGEVLRVVSTAAGVPADRMCRRILQRWAGNQGIAVAETQISVDPVPPGAAADPVAALAEADAVWPAHACTHAVVARLQGVEVRLITAEESGLPSVSALGLIARPVRSTVEMTRHAALLDCLETAAARLASDPSAALDTWRKAGGDDSRFGDAIVTASMPLLKMRIDRRPQTWLAFEALLEEA